MDEENRSEVSEMRRGVLRDAVCLGRCSDAFYAELLDLVGKYSCDLLQIIEALAARQLEDPDSNPMVAECTLDQHESQSLYCSFCAKEEKDVGQLIAGPSVFICDECVDLCAKVLRGELE